MESLSLGKMENISKGISDCDNLPLDVRIKLYEEKVTECLQVSESQPQPQERGSLEPFTNPEEIAQRLFPNLVEIHCELCNCQQKMIDEGFFKPGQKLWSDWVRSAIKMRKCLSENNNSKMSTMIARAYCNRGILKYMLVDFEGAISDYTEAMKYEDDLSELYYNRGMILYRLAFFKQAYADTEVAVRLEPDNEEYQSWLRHVKEMIGSPNAHEFELPLVGCEIETE